MVLALSCSTLSSLVAGDAFDRLFTVKWLSRPACIVNMAFLLVVGASLVFAFKIDSKSLKKVAWEEREKILMRGLEHQVGVSQRRWVCNIWSCSGTKTDQPQDFRALESLRRKSFQFMFSWHLNLFKLKPAHIFQETQDHQQGQTCGQMCSAVSMAKRLVSRADASIVSHCISLVLSHQPLVWQRFAI